MDKPLQSVALLWLEGLDTPFSLSVAILIKHEEWEQVARKSTVPSHYIDSPWGAERFKRDAQAVNMLRKANFLPIEVDRELATLDLFLEMERKCKQTNDRFHPLHIWSELNDPELHDPRIPEYFRRVRKIIRKWLGPLPQQLEGSFGPGAIFETRRQRRNWPKTKRFDRLGLTNQPRGLTLGDKLKTIPSVTNGARFLFEHYFWPSAWGRHHLSCRQNSINTCRGNRFFTVPKTALIDRGACVEPGGNVFLQLGVGAYLKHRLKLWGLDLVENKPLHMQLACIGSLNNSLATIDLSSASDTLAKHLVKFLLPGEWFALLDDLRSPSSRLPPHRGRRGGWYASEKFSSMGNGFTFELETLIFAALACALESDGEYALGDTVHVLGDDIVVARDRAPDLISILRYCGFMPNTKKTYSDGPFRESCGGDFFCGIDVRSHYIEEAPIEPTDWISLANGIFRRSCYLDLRQSPGFRARLRALDQLPSDIRCNRGPAELGDVIVHDLAQRWTSWQLDSIRWFRCTIPQFPHLPLWVYPGGVQMAVALKGVMSNGVVPRGTMPLGYEHIDVPYS